MLLNHAPMFGGSIYTWKPDASPVDRLMQQFTFLPKIWRSSRGLQRSTITNIDKLKEGIVTACRQSWRWKLKPRVTRVRPHSEGIENSLIVNANYFIVKYIPSFNIEKQSCLVMFATLFNFEISSLTYKNVHTPCRNHTCRC